VLLTHASSRKPRRHVALARVCLAAPDGDGVLAFWLDGRDTICGGSTFS
jgi:hypothetical protein